MMCLARGRCARRASPRRPAVQPSLACIYFSGKQKGKQSVPRVHPSPPERCPQGSGAVLLKIEQNQLRVQRVALIALAHRHFARLFVSVTQRICYSRLRRSEGRQGCQPGGATLVASSSIVHTRRQPMHPDSLVDTPGFWPLPHARCPILGCGRPTSGPYGGTVATKFHA